MLAALSCLSEELAVSWRDYCEPGPWDDDERELEDFCVTCKYCGASGLEWVEIEEGKWRLINSDGDVHSCARKSNPADDFKL